MSKLKTNSIENVAGTKTFTVDEVRAMLDSGGGGIGVGQTWQDVKASRVLGTSYTNNTGKPIMVNVAFSTSAVVSVMVGTVQVGRTVGIAGDTNTISTIVPNNTTYKAVGTGQVESWSELR